MTRTQVLRFLRDCHSTHSGWVEHYEKYPQEVRIHRLVAGSKASNKRLVKQYAATIRFIDRMAQELDTHIEWNKSLGRDLLARYAALDVSREENRTLIAKAKLASRRITKQEIDLAAERQERAKLINKVSDNILRNSAAPKEAKCVDDVLQAICRPKTPTK